MSILPVELIENILEHVYGEYRSPEAPLDLYQCALVSHTWRAISQPLIFSELLLCASQEARIQAFLDAQICHFRQYVCKVWINDVGGSDSIKEFFNWLPNIQELYVLCPGPISKSLERLHPETMSILRNLTSLGLSALISFPVKVFYHCHSLRELKVNGSTFEIDTTTHQQLPSRLPIPSLHSLHVTGFVLPEMQILGWMLTPHCPFELSALKTLRTSDRSDELQPYEWIQQIVRLCGPTLRDLAIGPPSSLALQDPKLTPENLLYPSTLLNLRVITISIIQEITDDINYVPWMNAFFSSLPVHNRLEEIRIPALFRWSLGGKNTHMEAEMAICGWEALDTILTSDYIKLKKVIFGVYGLRRPRGQILGSLLREKLPHLDGNGILEIRAYRWLSREQFWWEVK